MGMSDTGQRTARRETRWPTTGPQQLPPRKLSSNGLQRAMMSPTTTMCGCERMAPSACTRQERSTSTLSRASGHSHPWRGWSTRHSLPWCGRSGATTDPTVARAMMRGGPGGQRVPDRLHHLRFDRDPRHLRGLRLVVGQADGPASHLSIRAGIMTRSYLIRIDADLGPHPSARVRAALELADPVKLAEVEARMVAAQVKGRPKGATSRKPVRRVQCPCCPKVTAGCGEGGWYVRRHDSGAPSIFSCPGTGQRGIEV